LINSNQSHANVVSADSIFRIDWEGELVNAPFFDVEDEYFVKTDPRLASVVALELMDLFYGVNQGRNVVEFIPDFPNHIERLAKNTASLLAELKTSDRYQRVMAKQAAEAETPTPPPAN
jgi:hypothetical protein